MKKLLLIPVQILISFSLFSQSCLPTGLEITSQAQVDNFQADYPGCTQIEGGLEISGDDIVNLDGLSVLTSIGEYFYISNNETLENITGLTALTSVGGSLLVSSNPLLTGLAGLDNLAVVEEDVFISNNPVLTDISSIGNIDASSVTELWITNNISLSTCNIPFICDFLSGAYGKVRIYGNAPGCGNPPEIADECDIALPCLPFGDYYFKTQEEVDNFQNNYPGCSDLQGLVHIQGDNITNLAGLEVINSINGPLEITFNPLLPDLTGLDSIKSVGGTLTIVTNSVLTDISGLNQIDTGSITFLGINNNPLLAECDVKLVCDYLSGEYGASHNNITNNNDGCKNKDEVLQACYVGESELKDDNSILKISPNPATDVIFIEFPDLKGEGKLSVYNRNGLEIIRLLTSGPRVMIEVHEFTPGLYMVRLEGNGKVLTGKFVVIH